MAEAGTVATLQIFLLIRNFILKKTIIATALVALSAPAFADHHATATVDYTTTESVEVVENDARWGVRVGAGLTSGTGVEVSYVATPTVEVRLSHFTGDMSDTQTADDITYDAKLDLENTGAFLDWRPGGQDSGWRLIGGMVSNGNKLAATAQSAVSYDIGGTVYTPADIGTLGLEVKFKSTVPYAGFAYDIGGRTGFVASLEGGVLMQGSPDIEITSTGGLLSSDPTLLANIDAEVAATEADLEDFKYLPNVKFSLGWRW